MFDRWLTTADGGGSAGPWEGLFNPLLYYLDLATDLVLSMLTVAHYVHLWWLHGEGR
jgi:hypothetical protein